MKDKKLKESIINAIPLILLSFALMIYGIILFHKDFTINNVFNVILESIIAGFAEEFIFRKLVLESALKRWGNEKYIKCILFVAILFGLVHITNLFQGATIPSTITQVITATLIGIVFGLIYYRTKNFLFVAILHTVFDIGAGLSNGVNMIGTKTSINYLSTGTYLLFLILLISNFFCENKRLKIGLIILEIILIIPVILL
jgi:membrane protease YdiL (CAAX protease family)